MKYATTDKLNDSMKAKVFKYRSDGNTVVAPYMELEPYAENVYLSLSRKNEYGNEDDDCFHVVCRIENVYFSSGQYSRRFLNGENRRDETAAYCRNWIADTLQGAERGAFVRLISVRVFEALGLDTTPWCKPVRHTKEAGTETQGTGGERGGRAQSAGRAISAAAR